MLRSAGGFGADGVFIGTHRQVPVTSMVARSSAGVVNRIPIGQVADLSVLVDTLRARKVTVIAATEKAEQPLTACDFRPATPILVANEGPGLSPELSPPCYLLPPIP